MTATAVNADICYAKQYTRLLWQRMKQPGIIGARCMIYNGSFVPVYEGVVGKCIQGVSCGAEPLNVDIGTSK